MKENRALFSGKSLSNNYKRHKNSSHSYVTRNATRESFPNKYSTGEIRFLNKRRDSNVIVQNTDSSFTSKDSCVSKALLDDGYLRGDRDVRVGSIRALKRKRVQKIYMPETIDAGVGSWTVSNLFARRSGSCRRCYHCIKHKSRNAKQDRDIIKKVISKKLSPISIFSPIYGQTRRNAANNTSKNNLVASVVQYDKNDTKPVTSKHPLTRVFSRKPVRVVNIEKDILQSCRECFDKGKGHELLKDYSTNDGGQNQSSDEEVFKIIEYETIDSNSIFDENKENRYEIIGDHKSNDLKYIKTICSEIVVNSVSVTPRTSRCRDVIQRYNVSEFKKCDVIKDDEVSQSDVTEIKKPRKKCRDYLTDEDSECTINSSYPTRSQYTECYLKELYHHLLPLGIDFYSWCASDSYIHCTEFNSHASCHRHLQSSKSCPNLLDSYKISHITSSQNESCNSIYGKVSGNENKISLTKFILRKYYEIITDNNYPRRVTPRDSIEILKRRPKYIVNEKKSKCNYNKTNSLVNHNKIAPAKLLIKISKENPENNDQNNLSHMKFSSHSLNTKKTDKKSNNTTVHKLNDNITPYRRSGNELYFKEFSILGNGNSENDVLKHPITQHYISNNSPQVIHHSKPKELPLKQFSESTHSPALIEDKYLYPSKSQDEPFYQKTDESFTSNSRSEDLAHAKTTLAANKITTLENNKEYISCTMKAVPDNTCSPLQLLKSTITSSTCLTPCITTIFSNPKNKQLPVKKTNICNSQFFRNIWHKISNSNENNLIGKITENQWTTDNNVYHQSVQREAPVGKNNSYAKDNITSLQDMVFTANVKETDSKVEQTNNPSGICSQNNCNEECSKPENVENEFNLSCTVSITPSPLDHTENDNISNILDENNSDNTEDFKCIKLSGNLRIQNEENIKLDNYKDSKHTATESNFGLTCLKQILKQHSIAHKKTYDKNNATIKQDSKSNVYVVNLEKDSQTIQDIDNKGVMTDMKVHFSNSTLKQEGQSISQSELENKRECIGQNIKNLNNYMNDIAKIIKKGKENDKLTLRGNHNISLYSEKSIPSYTDILTQNHKPFLRPSGENFARSVQSNRSTEIKKNNKKNSKTIIKESSKTISRPSDDRRVVCHKCKPCGKSSIENCGYSGKSNKISKEHDKIYYNNSFLKQNAKRHLQNQLGSEDSNVSQHKTCSCCKKRTFNPLYNTIHDVGHHSNVRIKSSTNYTNSRILQHSYMNKKDNEDSRDKRTWENKSKAGFNYGISKDPNHKIQQGQVLQALYSNVHVTQIPIPAKAAGVIENTNSNTISFSTEDHSFEIHFKFIVTKEGKTAEMNVDAKNEPNTEELKKHKGKDDQCIYSPKNKTKEKIMEITDSNKNFDIKIVIKNFPPDKKTIENNCISEKKKCKDDKFSKNILEKFHEVSAGCSNILSATDFNIVNTFSEHKARIDLTSSSLKNKSKNNIELIFDTKCYSPIQTTYFSRLKNESLLKTKAKKQSFLVSNSQHKSSSIHELDASMISSQNKKIIKEHYNNYYTNQDFNRINSKIYSSHIEPVIEDVLSNKRDKGQQCRYIKKGKRKRGNANNNKKGKNSIELIQLKGVTNELHSDCIDKALISKEKNQLVEDMYTTLQSNFLDTRIQFSKKNGTFSTLTKQEVEDDFLNDLNSEHNDMVNLHAVNKIPNAKDMPIYRYCRTLDISLKTDERNSICQRQKRVLTTTVTKCFKDVEQIESKNTDLLKKYLYSHTNGLNFDVNCTNKDTTLGVFDKSNVAIFNKEQTKSSTKRGSIKRKKTVYRLKRPVSCVKLCDILQCNETKNAVLEIYQLPKNNVLSSSKLPKFIKLPSDLPNN